MSMKCRWRKYLRPVTNLKKLGEKCWTINFLTTVVNAIQKKAIIQV